LDQGRKKIDEILAMSQNELVQYLKDTDKSLQPGDSVNVSPFEHGIKAMYFHRDSPKPFKTRVFLKNIEGSEGLE